MINLAGGSKKDIADETVLEELKNASIDVVEHELYVPGEVKTIYSGKLGHWHFERAWYYWYATSEIGLSIKTATHMHFTVNPATGNIFGRDIRVMGSCGCPSPEEVYKDSNVLSYHVDTIEGLIMLAKTIKENL